MTKFAVITDNGRVEFTTHEAALQYLTVVGGIRIEQVDEVINTYQPVEIEVAMWRIRVVMGLAGLTSAIETAIASLPEPNKTVAQSAWNYGNTINRTSSIVAAIQQMIGLTNEQTDALFLQAEQLPA